MTTKFDCIVIGGGSNGLTTATLLAKQKRKVLLIEKNSNLGGLSEGYEFYPGYRTTGILNDTSLVRKRVIQLLKLEKFGLEYSTTPPSVYLPELNGPGLLLHHSPENSESEISRVSKRDANAYHRYRQFFATISPLVQSIFDAMPPDVYVSQPSSIWDLLRKAVTLRLLGKKDMMELLRIAPMSVADWLNEWFESELLKAGLAGPAVFGGYYGPFAPGTTSNLLMHEALSLGRIKGGGAALIKALSKCASDSGVQIMTGKSVRRIRIEAQSVVGVVLMDGTKIDSRCIAASCDPKTLFRELIDPVNIHLRLHTRMKQFRARGTTAKIHIALKHPLIFDKRPNLDAPYIRTCQSISKMEKAFDAIKYRRNSEYPILDIYQPTYDDPALAPAGHAVLSVLVHCAPYDLKEGWSGDTKDSLLKLVKRELGLLSSSFEESVVASEVLSPIDLSERYNLSGGHLFHGEHALDQMLQRPTPETARYLTPINGLFLCGSGSFPGGGITCAPGSLAVKAIGQ